MSEGPRPRISMCFGVFLYRCTDVSGKAAALSVRVRSLTDLLRSHVPKFVSNTYVVKYVCNYNRVHVKSKFPNPGI